MSSSPKRASSDASDALTTVSAKKQKTESAVSAEVTTTSAAPISPAVSSSEQGNDETEATISQRTSILAVLAAIKSSSPNQLDIMKAGFVFLSSLVKNNKVNLLKDVMTFDDITLITAVMKNNPTVKGLRDEGRVLLRLLCEKVKEAPDNDGIVAILAIMKELADDVVLQKKCCHVLKTVCKNGFTEFTGDAGGVPVLVSVLKNHANEQSLVSGSLGALVQLTHHALSNTQQIADAGGIALVVDTMKQHSKSLSDCRKSIIVLLNLAIGSEDRAKAIIDNGGHIQTISAMKLFSKNESLQESGCLALANLTDYDIDGSTERIVKAGAVATIVAAMMKYPGNVTVQQNACNALHNLTRGGKAVREAIIQAGGLEAISGAIRVHRSDQDVASAAQEAWKSVMEST